MICHSVKGVRSEMHLASCPVHITLQVRINTLEKTECAQHLLTQAKLQKYKKEYLNWRERELRLCVCFHVYAGVLIREHVLAVLHPMMSQGIGGFLKDGQAHH